LNAQHAQQCGLPTTQYQVELKVEKLTQIQLTSFKDGVVKNSWWFGLNVSIQEFSKSMSHKD
jgi:hypothetical protein